MPQGLDTRSPDDTLRLKARARAGLQLPISERRLMLMVGDGLASAASVFLALAIWAWVGPDELNLEFLERQVLWFILLPALWYILASANDFYNLRLASRLSSAFGRLVQIELQLLIIYLIIFFLSSRDALPRLFIVYYAILSFSLIGLWRAWRPFLIGWIGTRRALVIGTGWTAETILDTISEEASDDYTILGCICSANDAQRTVAGKPVLGTGADLPALVRRQGVAELIMAYGSELPGDVFEGVMTCYEQGISIVPMPILYEQITGRVPIEHVGQEHWTVVLPLDRPMLMFNLYLLAKRVVDIALALIGLACFAVLLAPLALIITLDSPGPVFYPQERVGRGGRLFKVIKLRTMIADAERETGPKWATVGDPRITRVGKLLRKTRLDEVPQLINVLRGEMSMVGPRPERSFFVDDLTRQIPFYRARLVVTPGLTGWAQVRYQYGNTVQHSLIKLQYDLYYIRHQSLPLDILIMLRTIGKMLAFQGT